MISKIVLIVLIEGIIALSILLFLLYKLHNRKNHERDGIKQLKSPSEKHDVGVFQVLQDDLRSFKTQQWNIIYYLILVLAALFALAKEAMGYRIGIIGFIAFFASAFAVYLIIELQYAMRNTRINMVKTVSYKRQMIEESQDDDKFCKDKKFIMLFFSTVIIGLFLLISQLLFKIW